MAKSSKLQNRNKRIEIRLTEDEYARIKEKSVGFCSIGHYIRSAIKEFSDINAKQKFEQLNGLADFYRAYRDDLSHISGNLNQSVKRANELSVAGLLTPAYISQILIPTIDRTKQTLGVLNGELMKVTEKVIKQTLRIGS